jgi:hypothetical protein
MQTAVDHPYPEDVLLACFLETVDRPDGTVMTHQQYGWDITNFAAHATEAAYDGTALCKVTVLDRKHVPEFFYNYTVWAHTGESDKDIEEVMNVPHSACTFVDLPYTSDIHLPRAFRHYIGLPNSIFPKSWQNANNDDGMVRN